MNANDFQQDAASRALDTEIAATKVIGAVVNRPSLARTLIAVMKINSESGELADMLVGHIVYGKPFDLDNLVEECGDILWYVSDILTANGITIEDAMNGNTVKLKIRYPEKFTEEHARLRLDKQ